MNLGVLRSQRRRPWPRRTGRSVAGNPASRASRTSGTTRAGVWARSVDCIDGRPSDLHAAPSGASDVVPAQPLGVAPRTVSEPRAPTNHGQPQRSPRDAGPTAPGGSRARAWRAAARPRTRRTGGCSEPPPTTVLRRPVGARKSSSRTERSGARHPTDQRTEPEAAVGPEGARTALRTAPAGCHCERFGCAYEAFLVANRSQIKWTRATTNTTTRPPAKKRGVVPGTSPTIRRPSGRSTRPGGRRSRRRRRRRRLIGR